MRATLWTSIVLIMVVMTCLPVGAATSDEAYRDAREAYHALQNSARKQMYREQWQKVIDGFRAVYERYPKTRRGTDALYMQAKTTAGLYAISRVQADAVQATKLYEQVAEVYPQNSLADDALLMAGELYADVLDQPRQAYLVYQRLVDQYPGGDMAGKARDRLGKLSAYKPEPQPDPVPVQPSRSTKAVPDDGPVGDVRLNTIRFWSNPGYTRIVLDLSGDSDFEAHFLAPDKKSETPPRLYVDITARSLADDIKEPMLVDDGLLQRIRTGKPDDDTIRVVLDLKSIGDYKVFPLLDPYRIVIDIAGDQVTELKGRDTELRALPGGDDDAIAKVLNDQRRDEPDLHIPAAPPSTTLRRIVVDAGHGGKDPGAVGPGGTYEKHVTLKLAKQLAQELRKQLNCEVILTRSGDVYLPLEERTAIANKVGADLFVSIHANANNSRKAYGIETYYLNFSKNDKAAAVVARENGTSLKQVSDLELILFDLMANSKINESSRLAAEIQKSLVDRLSRKYDSIRDMGVRQGPFYVLLGATMPSVLVETAFISNPREEKRLQSSKYQEHAAEAIAAAIKNYAIANKLIASR